VSTERIETHDRRAFPRRGDLRAKDKGKRRWDLPSPSNCGSNEPGEGSVHSLRNERGGIVVPGSVGKGKVWGIHHFQAIKKKKIWQFGRSQTQQTETCYWTY